MDGHSAYVPADPLHREITYQNGMSVMEVWTSRGVGNLVLSWSRAFQGQIHDLTLGVPAMERHGQKSAVGHFEVQRLFKLTPPFLPFRLLSECQA